jgi:hypothetical protein
MSISTGVIEVSEIAKTAGAPAFFPEAPRTLAELGIPESMVLDIAARHLTMRGTCSIHMLAHLLKMQPEMAEAVFRKLKDQNYIEVLRMVGDDYVFSLSPPGKKFAAERAISSKYAGPVPVPLGVWSEAVRAQVPKAVITREKLRAAFSDIVIGDRLLDALGPALISQKAIFLYGSSGTGKTTLSERLGRAFDEAIAVPYAVENDGQIIILGDPALHIPNGFTSHELDPRWIVCQRPLVAVGGELVMSMLDLQRDESTGAYHAPLQMKANNGILLIDDFGRQTISPRDLLNRWIVPLDRRVDFLSAGSGSKFDIPFETLVVFSTNLVPNELADEAFLRRIPNKIQVEAADPDAFDKIFRMTAKRMNLGFETGSEEVLRTLCLKHSEDLRPCFPRDICSAIQAIHLYEERQPFIRRTDLERAVTGYFVS